MISDSVRTFLKENQRGVLTTFRKDGGLQMSIVSCAQYRDGAAFTTPEGRAKLNNLKRDPRCALLVSKPNWFGYVVLEGKAQLLSPENTDPEELRMALRDVFRGASGGTEHSDWAEYDEAMVNERRSVVLIEPQRVFAPGL